MKGWWPSSRPGTATGAQSAIMVVCYNSGAACGRAPVWNVAGISRMTLGFEVALSVYNESPMSSLDASPPPGPTPQDLKAALKAFRKD